MGEARPEIVKIPYKEFRIELSIYMTQQGGYACTGNLVRPQKDGWLAVGLSIQGGEFKTREAAIEAGIAAGKTRADKGFDA